MTGTPVPHFHVDTVPYQPLPEFGGQEAILYKSPDGRRLAGTFQESGTHTMTMPFDEFIYVIAGTMKATVDGGEPFELGPGGCCWFSEGQEVTMHYSDDFHDVSVLVSDTPIEHGG